MMNTFVFLVVFISTYFLVQGLDQQSSGSQCQCCDQCDRSATVSQILLDMSNLLVSDHSVNTTTPPSTTSAPPSTTSTTTRETTTNPSTTQQPSTIIYSSEIRDSFATSTTVNPSTTLNPTTVNPPTVNPTTVNPSTVNPSTKTESFTTTNAATITESSSTKNPPITVWKELTIIDSSAKTSVCPENCYLDISGEYCNCYLQEKTEG